ncbi:hypothetical protein CEXT_349551 [Caerostris extrusa]|uniref:Uncharacterized protein n=1 Tax=Caerostris extrusa TaxID=172846 RepID=A0AAV4VAZ0_CAEEX|nr:hypothetical protein CEXT_349551 [Caerostris extrusa]
MLLFYWQVHNHRDMNWVSEEMYESTIQCDTPLKFNSLGSGLWTHDRQFQSKYSFNIVTATLRLSPIQQTDPSASHDGAIPSPGLKEPPFNVPPLSKFRRN